jgi:hypothetical protein
MTYQISATDPTWTFDGQEIERQVAAFAKSNGITTQATWTTFIAGISTLAQALAVCRGLLSSVKCSPPPP